MPYRPPDQSRLDQARQFYRDHPEAVRALREAGISPNDPRLLDPEWQKQNPDLIPFTQDSIADRKKRWYDKHPKGDPQSTTSKVLEFLGLDQPYYNDSRSYDYSQKKWQKSLDENNPDLSWMFPITDDMSDVASGSMANTFGEEDQRSFKDKVSGQLLRFLDIPAVGFGDEAVAGVMSYADDVPYQEALDKVRGVSEYASEHTPIWSQAPAIAGSVVASLPAFAAETAAANKGIGAFRKIFGFSPTPASAAGKTVRGMTSGSTAIAADDAAYQMGSVPGTAKERSEYYDPTQTAVFASLPIFMGAGEMLGHAYRGGKNAVRKGVDYLLGTKGEAAGKITPKPSAMDVPTTRTTGHQPRPRPKPNPSGDERRMRGPGIEPRSAPPRIPSKKPKPPNSVRQDIDLAMNTAKRRKE